MPSLHVKSLISRNTRMLGDPEKKSIAIAAACGVAVGAVVGALGYAAFDKISSSSTTRSSCAKCSQQTIVSHYPSIVGDPVRLPSQGSGEHGLPLKRSASNDEDTAKVLLELTRRMESLEQAVRAKVLSRSGSSVGYLTAQEDSDEEFQDLEDNEQSR